MGARATTGPTPPPAHAATRRTLLGAVLAAGIAPPFLRHARAADVARFGLGVASGQPRADGVVLWTRLLGAALPERVEVRWEVAHDAGFGRVAARGAAIAHAEDAHSVHAERRGLEPDRWYWYRFHALGQASPPGRTRTAPAADAPAASLAFALASCQRFDHGHYAAWADAATRPLDLVAFVGDYIYEYGALPNRVREHVGGPLRTLADYRARYAQTKADPALQAAHAAFPWLLVWDDHEVANDYAGLQSETRLPGFAARRAAAYQAYWEHMPLPNAARPAGSAMRIHARLDWGRLARWHLLDDRQHRDPQACPRPGRGGSNVVRRSECPALDDPRRTLLGAAQERWLADGWSLGHRWNLVAQQTLMAPFVRDEADADPWLWTDGWDGYPAARRRLLEPVAARRVPGVVVLGGDLHANVVAELRADPGDPRAPVVASEFCGTSITSDGPSQARMDRQRRLNPHLVHAGGDQHGYAELRATPRELRVELRLVDDVREPASPVRGGERFAVEAGRARVLAG